MGESSDTPLKLQFDRRVRLDFRGATITSDAGLLACRELDAALGLTETANDYIHESRTGRNGGILKKCVNGQAVYPLSEQDGLKAQERRYTAYGKEKH